MEIDWLVKGLFLISSQDVIQTPLLASSLMANNNWLMHI